MQFSHLSNEVILEIFLQFVAVDWDGPFTLILVCNKWSNLIVSQPQVWTWIMVDETQAEWRERMEIGARLSENLPLQIVLKVPFESRVSLSHITWRCSTLFLDSKHLDSYLGLGNARTWGKNITSYANFTQYSADYKQRSDSLLNFLKGAPIDDIQIRSEDPHYSPFAHSAWHIYERLIQRESITEVLKSQETFIITALIFSHPESAPFPRIKVLVTDLWGIPPLLSNLSYLELADNYIRVPKGTVLAHINLVQLHTLTIDSPMVRSVFSLKDDVWLGILSLLDSITAPKLEELRLESPLHRIVAAMLNWCGRFNLLYLHVAISEFDETADRALLDRRLILHGLRRCSICIAEPTGALRQIGPEVVESLRLVFNLIPKHCSVQLDAGEILESLMQSDLLRDVELHIITRYPGYAHEPLRNPRTIRSLSLFGEGSEETMRVPWISSVEELWTDVPTLIYPPGTSLPMRALESKPLKRFQPEFSRVSTAITTGSFSNLVDIQCDCQLALWMISMNETPQLRSLILSGVSGSHVGLSGVLRAVDNAGHRLLSLATLGIRGYPDWEPLLHFVANFNRPMGGGISTVKLGELPHPAILSHLGRAFMGEADAPEQLLNLFMYQRNQIKAHHPDSCFPCVWFGWSCHGDEHCSKFHSEDMVEITTDMPLAEYGGDWGPDGQGWGRALQWPDERGTGTNESAGATSEALVESHASTDSN